MKMTGSSYFTVTQVTVVPKQHFQKSFEMDADSNALPRVLDIARKVMKATGAKGMKYPQQQRRIAGQTVFHTMSTQLPSL